MIPDGAQRSPVGRHPGGARGRGKEKQLEKEIPWEHIPPTERDEYRKAEATQRQEHA